MSGVRLKLGFVDRPHRPRPPTPRAAAPSSRSCDVSHQPAWAPPTPPTHLCLALAGVGVAHTAHASCLGFALRRTAHIAHASAPGIAPTPVQLNSCSYVHMIRRLITCNRLYNEGNRQAQGGGGPAARPVQGRRACKQFLQNAKRTRYKVYCNTSVARPPKIVVHPTYDRVLAAL